MKTLVPAVILALALPAFARQAPAASVVVFERSPQSSAVRNAVLALRRSEAQQPALSDVSAAFIDLNGDRQPELIVRLSGEFCGSGGCDVMLFTMGPSGWVKVNEWLAGNISVSPLRDAGWSRIIINHQETWKHSAKSYVGPDGKLGETGSPVDASERKN